MKIREHRSDAIAGGPGDLLAAVPHLIGFHPYSSMVVVCVDLEEGRTGLIMRLDLPAARHEEEYAAQLAQRIEWHPPDAVILACYGATGAPPGSEPAESLVPPERGGLPGARLIEHLLDHLAGSPVQVLGTVYVDDGRWWTYDCDHPGCCPPDGVPLPGPGTGAAAQVAARTALQGRRTLASRRELEDGVRGPSGAREADLLDVFARVDRELAAEALAGGGSAVRERTVALARDLVARSAEGRLDLTDDQVARLSLGASDILVRDRLAAFETSDPAAWLGLLTALARRTPDARATAICAILAWVAYQQGDGAVANVALDRVQAVDPGHTLAGLLRDCLDGQVEPGHIAAATRAAIDAAGRARGEVRHVGAP
ncbi:DUF4192 domain-containing protein [Jiangella mangrovi]|uniref:DUF4192 domain-containing protein n=1 Tax=Jiangella mangrovi TaxID=1524084 RepID=A0A7W9GX02_9ACTN|nr:DUF4192 domain-containing protein [Jiangella mangrovi]MBB5791527.1 hypothetical protein [Jiangella mangrovi]